jgi:hypothetical protein
MRGWANRLLDSGGGRCVQRIAAYHSCPLEEIAMHESKREPIRLHTPEPDPPGPPPTEDPPGPHPEPEREPPEPPMPPIGDPPPEPLQASA